jgi:uncharacterized membrane protein
MARKPILDRAEHRAEELAKSGRRVINADRYVVVLALLGIVILTNAFLVQGSAGMFLLLIMLAVTLVFTLATSRVGWRTAVWAGICVAAGFGVGITAQIVGKVGDARLGYQIAIMVMGVIIAAVIVRSILRHPEVSVETVAGAASIYLLFGLVFAVLYAFVGDLTIIFQPAVAAQAGTHPSAAEAFFVSARTPLPSDFLYFSFVTLTTVGYGDLTAVTQFGRMLSVCEALLGQLYLVTVVAILVSNLRGGAKRAEA